MKNIQFVFITSLIGLLAALPACAQPAQPAFTNSTATEKPAAPGLKKLGQLPAEVQESSGLAPANQPNLYYTLGDAGTEPVLFKINTEAHLVEKIRLNIPNNDWESLAYDNSGNLYICDCGNNDNNRRDLAAYKVNPERPDMAEKISFQYPDQQDFPPRKKHRNFDSEASFWHQGNLYLFSRDRGRQETSKVYRVPATAGNHQAELLTNLKLEGEVTGAALSPGATRMALLTKENIYLFGGANLNELLQASPTRLSNQGVGQTEGIEFMNEQTLLISSEEGGLFQLVLP